MWSFRLRPSAVANMLSLDGSDGGKKAESGPTAGGNYIKIQEEDGAMNQAWRGYEPGEIFTLGFSVMKLLAVF